MQRLARRWRSRCVHGCSCPTLLHTPFQACKLPCAQILDKEELAKANLMQQVHLASCLTFWPAVEALAPAGWCSPVRAQQPDKCLPQLRMSCYRQRYNQPCAQVKHEIQILTRLRHPHIVDLREVTASQDKIYMVMELVPGGELFDHIIANGPLPVRGRLCQEVTLASLGLIKSLVLLTELWSPPGALAS